MFRAILPLLAVASVTATGQAPAPPEGHPGFLEAGALFELCREGGELATDSMSVCVGYIVGAVDQMLVPGDTREPAACFPPETTGAELVMTVLAYEPAVEAIGSVAAADFLRHVFADAYPCPLKQAAPK